MKTVTEVVLDNLGLLGGFLCQRYAHCRLQRFSGTIACDIHDYFSLNGKLPLVLEDINISSLSITYTVEDDSSWILMSGDSLIYYSDMDPIEFASGEI